MFAQDCNLKDPPKLKTCFSPQAPMLPTHAPALAFLDERVCQIELPSLVPSRLEEVLNDLGLECTLHHQTSKPFCKVGV